MADFFNYKAHYGLVHVAFAHHYPSQERWYGVSDQPTTTETFVEYGLRFDIEESFLDDKSNGFQLESSRIRSAAMLSRLCFVLAVATLYLTRVGTAVVAQGERRQVDPHWFRGSSYFKIGWHWIRKALVQGWTIPTTIALQSALDLDPCIPSKSQAANRSTLDALQSIVLSRWNNGSALLNAEIRENVSVSQGHTFSIAPSMTRSATLIAWVNSRL